MPHRLDPAERQHFLAMAERRIKPGAGRIAPVLRKRSARYQVPDLKRMLEGVPFILIGGLATRLYMPERMTLDIDVLVAPERLTEAEAALQRRGAHPAGALTVGGSSWRLPGGFVLDVLAPADPWVDEALAHPVPGDDGLPYAALPWLAVMKLTVGRVQDLADISRMLGAANGAERNAVRDCVNKWRPSEIADLESLIRLGILEVELPDA